MRFQNANLAVSSTASGAWTEIEPDASLPALADLSGTVIDFQGVYWDGTSGKDLKIRDAYDNVIYHAISDGDAVVDLLASPLTVRLPLDYLTDEATKAIVIYGKVLS